MRLCGMSARDTHSFVLRPRPIGGICFGPVGLVETAFGDLLLDVMFTPDPAPLYHLRSFNRVME